MRKWSLVAVVVATAAALALMVGGANNAAAKPKRVCENGKCKTVCREILSNGNIVDYDEGTSITVTNPSGEKTSYKCKNGEWVRTREVVGARPFEFPTRK